jgi:hypothetical protein
LSRKASLLAVERESGLEREMCSGNGAPRSLVRKFVNLTLEPTSASTTLRSCTKRSCCVVVGCPREMLEGVRTRYHIKEVGGLTFDVDMGRPVTRHMRRLSLPALVETGIIGDALTDSRRVKVVEGRRQWRHIGLSGASQLPVGAILGNGLGFFHTRRLMTILRTNIILTVRWLLAPFLGWRFL